MLLCLGRIPHASKMGPSQVECPGSENPSIVLFVHFSLADFPQEHHKSLLQRASLSLRAKGQIVPFDKAEVVIVPDTSRSTYKALLLHVMGMLNCSDIQYGTRNLKGHCKDYDPPLCSRPPRLCDQSPSDHYYVDKYVQHSSWGGVGQHLMILRMQLRTLLIYFQCKIVDVANEVSDTLGTQEARKRGQQVAPPKWLERCLQIRCTLQISGDLEVFLLRRDMRNVCWVIFNVRLPHAYAHAATLTEDCRCHSQGVVNGSSPASMEAECKMTLVDCVLCLLFLGRRMRGPWAKGFTGATHGMYLQSSSFSSFSD